MFDRDLLFREGDTLVVHSPEILDISNVNVFDGLEDKIADAQTVNVLFDLSSTTFMDSSGVGVLVRLFRFCHGKNVDFCLRAPTGQPLSLLTMLKVTDVMQIA